ncbi:hypothetical protein ACFL2D_01880 [Patescibacteria group bacterium]
MKRIITSLTTAALSAYAIAIAPAAHALDTTLDVTGISKEENVTPVVIAVINWILAITAAVAILVLIVGGFRYITSAGNDKRVQAAKTTITYAIVGLIIVLLAYVIAATINAVIGAP